MNRLAELLAEHAGGRPTLLLDEAAARANIARMAAKARKAGVPLRPHFKTHQSAVVGRWFRDEGVGAITVSSLDMAAYFADAGWDDITVALPLDPLSAPRAAELSQRLRLGLLAESATAVEALAAAAPAPGTRIWIKLDTGYGRTGVPWTDVERLVGLARCAHVGNNLEFAGLLTHAGHSYHQDDPAGVRRVWEESIARLRVAGAAVEAAGFGPCLLSAGDTPGCSVVEDLSGPDELRPGNFVFYDLMQAALGACRDRDIAVALACPVLSVHPERGEAVLHGGAVHLGKEFLTGADGRPYFGVAAAWTAGGRGAPLPGSRLISLSQEHGVLKLGEDGDPGGLEPGDAVAILPVHSCLTADLHPAYMTLAGERIPRRRSNDPA